MGSLWEAGRLKIAFDMGSISFRRPIRGRSIQAVLFWLFRYGPLCRRSVRVKALSVHVGVQDVGIWEE